MEKEVGPPFDRTIPANPGAKVSGPFDILVSGVVYLNLVAIYHP
jgi:hypothetical protein